MHIKLTPTLRQTFPIYELYTLFFQANILNPTATSNNRFTILFMSIKKYFEAIPLPSLPPPNSILSSSKPKTF